MSDRFCIWTYQNGVTCLHSTCRSGTVPLHPCPRPGKSRVGLTNHGPETHNHAMIMIFAVVLIRTIVDIGKQVASDQGFGARRRKSVDIGKPIMVILS